MAVRFGLLLPHFGSNADFGLIRDGSQIAESVGFDSVWVRDHILYEPHSETDDPDPAFLEATVTLAAIAAATTRLSLGTSALVPLRHPLMTAKVLSSISAMFERQILVGLGAGGFDHEFAALGYPDNVPRSELVDATARTCRALWSGGLASQHDSVFDFTDVAMRPLPSEPGIQLWMCGSGLLAAKRAAREYDGWLPARITLRALDERRKAMETIVGNSGRPMPTVGLLALTSIANDGTRALDRIPLDGLMNWANHNKFAQTWPKPAGGRYETPDDIAGTYIAGAPEEVVDQCRRVIASGVEHLVFDLRNGFDSWHEQIELLGASVLPHIG